MRLNLITESSSGTQLPSGVQCTPTYCMLEPGSSRVAVGLRNLSSRSITIPLQSVVGQLQQATIQKVQTSGKQNKQGPTGKEGTFVLDQLNLEWLDNWTEEQQRAAKNLLVDSADVFSKDDLDLGKCNILKHNITITDPQPFIERYRRIPPYLYELTYKRWWKWGQSGGVSVHGPVLWCWSDRKMESSDFALTCIN